MVDQFSRADSHVQRYDGLLVRQIMRSSLAGIEAGTRMHGDDALTLLRASTELTEAILAELCSRHSKFMLLLLTRMLVSPLMLINDPAMPELDLAPLGIMTAAALKYGSTAYEACLQAEPIEPFQCTQEQARDVRCIWELSAYLDYLAGLRMMIGEGVHIKTRVDAVFADEPGRPNDMDLLQRRRQSQNWKSLLSSSAYFGVLRPEDWIHDPDPAHPLILFACPVTLLRGAEKPGPMQSKASAGIGVRREPHYVLRHWDQHHVTQLLSLNSEAISSEYHVSPIEYAVILQAITARTIHDIARHKGCMDTTNATGLAVFSYRNFARSLVAGIGLASSLLGVSRANTLARRCLHHLLMDDSQYQTLDLSHTGIRSIFYKFGNHVVVDWLLTADLLKNLLTLVSGSAHMRNTKGAQFEVRLGKYIAERIPSSEWLFPPNKRLRRDGKLFAEVDLSYRVGEFGFIVDCKAYQLSAAYMRGDAKALQTRWSYTEEWLGQVTGTARVVAMSPKGDNYELPDGINYLIPIVCSTTVERIYFEDELHLLAPGVPRTCTPFELEELLRNPSPNLPANSYSFRVTGRMEE